MNIIVLAKHAIDTESRGHIAADGKSLEKRGLVYDINDWDKYAVEEAIRIKEKKGAEVVVVSAGSDCDPTLRRCLAMGADRAINIPFDSMDGWQIAEVISEAIKAEKFDLILAGFQSQDLNNALVGPILAGMLDLPYATAVISIEFEDKGVKVRRELEGGFQEEITLPLPCLLTIQTDINKPRYASMLGIKRAKTKEIKEVFIVPKSSTLEIEKMYFPSLKKAETIEGSPDEIVAKLIEVLKGRGLL